METSLLPLAYPVRSTGGTYGCAGDGRVGLVAADDAAAGGVALLAGAPEPGRDYQVTGPQALSSADIAAALGRALGRDVDYHDMSEDAFRDPLVQYAGMTPEQAEIGVIAHYRAWREGGADLVTDTLRELTGREPTSIDACLQQHLDAFR
jgi:NAD(P)H dehydrogenase (quinone)